MNSAGRLKAAGWGKGDGVWAFGGGPRWTHAATGDEIHGYTTSVFYRGRRRTRKGYELWVRTPESENDTHRYVRCADTLRELVEYHATRVQVLAGIAAAFEKNP
jgi:hypothetical protein